MIGQFKIEDAKRLRSSQRKCRCRRIGERDDDGEGDKVGQPKQKRKRKPLKIPTNAEQSELLQKAFEKELVTRGFKGCALKQELRNYEHVFSASRARHLHVLNPYAGVRWARIFAEAISECGSEGALWTVTIISDDWMIAPYRKGSLEHALRFILRRMRAESRRGLRGISYLLQADFALRRHVFHRHLCIEIHWHGVVWATADQIKAIKRRFPVNRFGADGFAAERADDLPGWCEYATKDTRLGYVTVRNFRFRPQSRHWKAWFQHREAIAGPKREWLIAMIGNLTKPELCSASGEGLVVLREAKRLARERGYRAAPVVAPGTVHRRESSRKRRKC
jgi:hypothetical protein